MYFVDQVGSIIDQLQNRFQVEYFQPQALSEAYFMTCSGEDIRQNVDGNVVVSGVGAFTIIDIIKSLHQRQLLQAEKLILVPQRDEGKLIRFLDELPGFNDVFELKQFEVEERGRRKKVLIYIRL